MFHVRQDLHVNPKNHVNPVNYLLDSQSLTPSVSASKTVTPAPLRVYSLFPTQFMWLKESRPFSPSRKSKSPFFVSQIVSVSLTETTNREPSGENAAPSPRLPCSDLVYTNSGGFTSRHISISFLTVRSRSPRGSNAIAYGCSSRAGPNAISLISGKW